MNKKIRFRIFLSVSLSALIFSLFCVFGFSDKAGFEIRDFPLQDNDTWVMVGDSITAQHLHSNYFEAYCYARFPQWTFHFRNSGVSGDTLPAALARFDWDCAPWKPTVVSVELGMNDSGAGLDSVTTYINRMKTMTQRIRELHARPVFFTSSAVNDGTLSSKIESRNAVLDKYATALGDYARQENAPFTDQFHSLLDVWGHNYLAQVLFRFSDQIQNLPNKSDIPGSNLLAQWTTQWVNSNMAKQGIDLKGDPVHPGPPGQLTMCAALLQGLHAPGMVSYAALNARGKVVEFNQCQITKLKKEKTGLSFNRLDSCLPLPIPDDARSALVIYPSIADLSQWTLKVLNLKSGNYEIRMDGKAVVQTSSDQLALGFNLGTLDKGPVADQCRQILKLVADKENLVGQWRAKSAENAKNPAGKDHLALVQLNQLVLQADSALHDAAQPKPHHFEILLVQ